MFIIGLASIGQPMTACNYRARLQKASIAYIIIAVIQCPQFYGLHPHEKIITLTYFINRDDANYRRFKESHPVLP